MLHKIYTFNQDMAFSPSLFRLKKGKRAVKLSSREAELLSLLCDEVGKVVSRGSLLEALWPGMDSSDANLNRTILSLRRKFESLGVMDAIDTIPRVGYIFKPELEIGYQDESPEEESIEVALASDTEASERSEPEVLAEKRSFFTRRASGWAAGLACCLLLLSAFHYGSYKPTDRGTLQVMDLSLHNISLYMSKEAELVHKQTLARLAKMLEEEGHGEPGKVSIAIGKRAISYFMIDHERKILNANVFMLRAGREVMGELKCVINTMHEGGSNVSGNYYDAVNSTTRFHKDCQATGNWIETRHRSHLLVNGEQERLLVISLVASDANQKNVFKAEMVGNVERIDNDEFDIHIDINSSSVSRIDQKSLLENSLVSTLLGAVRSSRQAEHYLYIPGGLYLSSYLDGILIWPAKESLRVVRY